MYTNHLITGTITVCLIAGACLVDLTSMLCPILINLDILLERWKTVKEPFSNILNILDHKQLIKYLIIVRGEENEKEPEGTNILPILLIFVEMLLSAFMFPWKANRCGRRRCLIILSILMVLYVIFIIFLATFLPLDLLLMKGSIIVIFTYTSEIPHPDIRGVVMVLPKWMAFTGFLFGFYMAYYSLLIILIFSQLAAILATFFCQETAQFYEMRLKSDEASESLSAFRDPDTDTSAEFYGIQSTLNDQYEQPFCHLLRMCISKNIMLLLLFLFLTANVFLSLLIWRDALLSQKELPRNVFPEYFILFIISAYLLMPLFIYYFDRKLLLFYVISVMAGIHGLWLILYIFGGLSLPILPALLITGLLGSYELATIIILIVITEVTPTRIKTWALSIFILIFFGLAIVFIMVYSIFTVIMISVPIFGFMIQIGAWANAFFLMYKLRDRLTETRGKTLEQIYTDMYPRDNF